MVNCNSWGFLAVSSRIWQTIEIHLYQEIPQNLSLFEILNISSDLWQFRAEFEKKSKSIYTRKSHKINHFLRFLTFLAETEHFEQESQKRLLIGMSYLPKETLCFWPLPTTSDRNWTFRTEIAKTRIDRHVIFTEGNLMFLTTFQDFWQNIWYLIKNWWCP